MNAGMVNPWEGWELTPRIFNALAAAGITNQSNLADVTFADIRRLRNMGSWSLQLLRDEMARHGMRLAGDPGRIGDSRARKKTSPPIAGWFPPGTATQQPREVSTYEAYRFRKHADFVSSGGGLPAERGDFVYVLMLGEEPMYAGATTNILARIGTHLRDRPPFDGVLWQRTPPGSRFVVESWLIRGLLPPWNGYSRYRREARHG